MKIFAVILASLLASASFAQKSQKNHWDQEAFDISRDSLPKNYQGHECRRVVSAIKSRKLKKDEYETSEQFAKRLSDLDAKPLFGSITISDNLGLIRRSRLNPDVKYDADKNVLSIQPHVNGRGFFVVNRYFTADSLEIPKSKEGSYVGTNAYGAIVRVRKLESDGCFVVFPSPHYDIRRPLIIEIPNIDPSRAKAIKSEIDVVYIGRPSEPYIHNVIDYHKATIDYPVEITTTGNALVIDLAEIWAIHRPTGEILTKMKP